MDTNYQASGGTKLAASLPRLFVSHSSSDKAFTKQVRDHIVPPRAKRKYEILLDIDRLDKGRPWEPYLHEWMARCHAGLVLLTKASVKSDWVLKETTILAWRLSLDPSFKLFIVRFPDVKDRHLEEGKYGPLGLERIQWLTDTGPIQIAAQVKAELDKLAVNPTPFDLLVDKLAAILKNVDGEILETVAGKLDVFKAWAPGGEERRRYLEKIAQHLLCGNLGRYRMAEGPAPPGKLQGLNALFGDLAGATEKEVLLQALKILATHWVDGEAAGHLALLPAHKQRRAVALNGEFVQDFTAEIYKTRAHLTAAENYYFLPVAGANAGGIVAHYTEQICDAVRAEPEFAWLFNGLENKDVIQKLKELPAVRYVVIPPPVPDGKDLVELVDRFPTVNFVLWTGRELNPDDNLSRVDWATPALGDGVEFRERIDYSASQATIARQENA
jgi:hypothetical protein